MPTERKYQLTIDMADAVAGMVRRDPGNPVIKPLAEILDKHNAILKCHYDIFAKYLAEAEKQGKDQYPLYEWTRDTIHDVAKKARYIKSFSLHVDGHEVYARDTTELLEADLLALVSRAPSRPARCVGRTPEQTRYQSSQQSAAAEALSQVTRRYTLASQ